MAALLPPRRRAALGYLFSGLLNPPQATLSIVGAWLSDRVAGVLILLLYWVVLGLCALMQRLHGMDWLGQRPGQGSLFIPRVSSDDDADDLRRPY